MTKFAACLKSDAAGKKIDADYQSAIDYGVQGTPATFINGQLLSGAVPYDILKAQIDALLK